MTSAEFTEYVQFQLAFPWDRGFALIACLITNMMRKEGSEPRSVDDFMPADMVIVDEIEQTWENLRALSKDPRYGER